MSKNTQRISSLVMFKGIYWKIELIWRGTKVPTAWIFQFLQIVAYARRLMEHEPLDGLLRKANASGNRSRGVGVVVQSRSATAAYAS